MAIGVGKGAHLPCLHDPAIQVLPPTVRRPKAGFARRSKGLSMGDLGDTLAKGAVFL